MSLDPYTKKEKIFNDSLSVKVSTKNLKNHWTGTRLIPISFHFFHSFDKFMAIYHENEVNFKCIQQIFFTSEKRVKKKNLDSITIIEWNWWMTMHHILHFIFIEKFFVLINEIPEIQVCFVFVFFFFCLSFLENRKSLDSPSQVQHWVSLFVFFFPSWLRANPAG